MCIDLAKHCLDFWKKIANMKIFIVHSFIGVLIPVGTLISIRDTRMIPKILKTKKIKRSRRKDAISESKNLLKQLE